RVPPVGEQRDLQVTELGTDALDEREHRVAVDAVRERAVGRRADDRTVARRARDSRRGARRAAARARAGRRTADRPRSGRARAPDGPRAGRRRTRSPFPLPAPAKPAPPLLGELRQAYAHLSRSRRSAKPAPPL